MTADHDHNHTHSGHSHDDHDHGHDHGHGHGGHHHAHSMRGKAPTVIVRAILVTFVFMIVELVGGWMSNSLALISDAAHMLTDIGAMLLSLFAIWVARRPVTLTMSFGYHRAEILGALLSGLLIWLISGVLIYEAVIRMQSPPEVQGPIVFVVAVIGLAANLFSMWMLHAAKEDNLNVRAAYLHLLSDSLGSVGAIIAGIVLWLTDWRPIDPIVTVIFAGLMLVSSWSLVKEAVGVLMESTPSHVDPTQIQKHLVEIEGVQEAHDLHIWTVSSGRLALSVHLVSESAEVTLKLAHELLREKFGIVHTTIQVEHPDKFQSERCYDCKPIEIRSTQ
jgi:cobalt-zinc-cadmium efflux system protein